MKKNKEANKTNRVEKFKNWVNSNKIASIIVIVGLIIIGLSKVVDALQKLREVEIVNSTKTENEIDLEQTKKLINEEIQALKNYYSSFDSKNVDLKEQFGIVNNVENINVELNEMKELNGTNQINEFKEEFVSMKKMMLENTFQLIEIYEDSILRKSNEEYRLSIISNCKAVLQLCEFDTNPCTKDEIKVISNTLNTFQNINKPEK